MAASRIWNRILFHIQGIDTAPSEHASILELSQEQIGQPLDREVRRSLATSGEELVAATGLAGVHAPPR